MNERRWQYAVHPGVQMTRGIIAKLKEKTGRSLDEWVELAQTGPAADNERVAWLKEKHGLGTNYAGTLQNTDGQAKADRITHRIAISNMSDIDSEVEQHLQQAYRRDA